jgi:hypothetical protein
MDQEQFARSPRVLGDRFEAPRVCSRQRRHQRERVVRGQTFLFLISDLGLAMVPWRLGVNPGTSKPQRCQSATAQN